MKIKFIDVEQVWQHETTRYWFNVDGDEYCIADQNGDLTLLDCDGCPTLGSNRDHHIYNALIRSNHIPAAAV